LSAEALLSVDAVDLRFGAVEALSGVSFEVGRGELLAVIGANGAGKSSLFNVLSRVYRPSAGRIELAGQDLLALRRHQLPSVGVARTFQNLGLFGHLTALENVLLGRNHLIAAGMVRNGFGWPAARAAERGSQAAALDALRLVSAEKYADVSVALLSYGVQKRIEVARALVMEPRLLLLDEPVAGMDAGERAEMTDLILAAHRERSLTTVLIEHDMSMVMGVAERVVVLDFGRVIASGAAAEVQADDAVIRAYLGTESVA
jgi:branched-chain amino acid transport system ATP-binding protein